jgi:homocysteine S-methyltransferase
MLPQLAGGTFVTDGGMETTLIFHDGLELPCFASFVLLEDDRGCQALRSYYARYVALAREHGVGLVLDAPTWRANRDWGAQLGYSEAALEDVNRRAVALVEELRAEAAGEPPIVVSGCIGPRGDAYRPAELMSAGEAEAYHSAQVATLADTTADLVSALTLTYAQEAVGIARAASTVGVPVAISFTVETDGRLPSGQPLGDAIAQVDAETDGTPAYFMINCAHPSHFAHVLEEGAPWVDRIHGLRANASALSHAELDEAEELDEGDPDDLAARYAALRPVLREVNVVGGCCGTDHRHIAAIAAAWQTP